MNRKGLIIIGGGITGLSSGITWAMNNDIRQKPVLIIEKQPIVGGFVTSFRRGGFLFDITQILPDMHELFNYFGIKIDLVKIEGCYTKLHIVDPANGKKRVYSIPSGLNEFERMLKERFPEESIKIENFILYSREMYQELYNLKVEPNIFQLIKTAVKCPKIVKNAGRTFKEYYDRFGISEPEIREIFDAFAAFSALPAQRVSALLTVSAMNTTLEGAYKPKNGFIDLPVKLRKRFLELGGEIKTKSEVKKIIIQDGKVKGVLLDNNDFIESENIVTTIDPRKAMLDLVGLDKINKIDPGYAEKLESVKMSPSSITINLGLDENINLDDHGINDCYSILTTGKGTFEKLFKEFDGNSLGLSNDCFHLAVIRSAPFKNKKPAICIRVVPVPMADWNEIYKNDKKLYIQRKEKISNFCIGIVEKYLIPDLKCHIILKDVSTPATFSRFSGSPTGSNYDMSAYPENFGRKRLKMRTPIKGLYQPKFSHGIWPCMQAGLQVVDMILKGKVMNGNSRFRAKDFPIS